MESTLQSMLRKAKYVELQMVFTAKQFSGNLPGVHKGM